MITIEDYTTTCNLITHILQEYWYVCVCVCVMFMRCLISSFVALFRHKVDSVLNYVRYMYTMKVLYYICYTIDIDEEKKNGKEKQ